MSDKPLKSPMLDWSEHAEVNGVSAKKVVVVDNSGNQFLGGGFNLPTYDEVVRTSPTASSEVYTYKLQDATVATLTITYTNSTKQDISSVVREV